MVGAGRVLLGSGGKVVDFSDCEGFGYFGAEVEGVGVVVCLGVVCELHVEPALGVVSCFRPLS